MAIPDVYQRILLDRVKVGLLLQLDQLGSLHCLQQAITQHLILDNVTERFEFVVVGVQSRDTPTRSRRHMNVSNRRRLCRDRRPQAKRTKNLHAADGQGNRARRQALHRFGLEVSPPR